MSVILKNHIGVPCPYCDKTMGNVPHQPTRDHIHPRSMGGNSHHRNIVIVCGKCNNDKRSRTMHGFLQKLEADGDARARRVRAFMKRNGFSFGTGGFLGAGQSPP